MEGLLVFTMTMMIWLVMMQNISEDEGCRKVNVTMRRCPVFDCSHRHLKPIPQYLPNDTCGLLLRRNGIKVLRSGCLKRYRMLTLLDLSQNKIQEIQEGAFDGADELLTLLLHDNALHFSNSCAKIFKPLRKLEKLTLHKNKLLDYADQVLRELISLQHLEMDGLKNGSFGTGYLNLSLLHDLTLSGISGRCNIQWLTNDTFRNVIYLRKLDVSFCNITIVATGALTPLKGLTTFDISGNDALKQAGLENITYGLKDSFIRRLFVNNILDSRTTCNLIQTKHIRYLQNTSLLEIHANGNGLSGFGDKTLEVLPTSLKRAFLLYNRFSYGPYVHNFQNLTGLQVLILNCKPVNYHIIPYSRFSAHRKMYKNYMLSVSNVNTIQQECANTSDSAHRHEDWFLQTLPSGFQRFRTGHTRYLTVPPNLTKVEYTYSELSFCISEIHFGENNLNLIDMSSNVLTIWQGPLYGLHKLTHLNLSNNIAHFVSKYFFSELYQLTHLDISLNYLEKSISTDSEGELFENLTRLQFLNLSLNKISFVPKQLFRGLQSLRILDLSQNRISNVSFTCSSLVTKQLSDLFLSQNEIIVINSHDLALIDRIATNHKFSIDLSQNPFSCVCELIPFLNWLGTTSVHNYATYNCTFKGSNLNIEMHRVDIVHKLTETCEKYFSLVISVLLFFFLSLIIIFSAVVYRYRWKLSYLYYATRLRFKADKTVQLDYDYDAFVSFAEEDRSFVLEELVPMLETEKGLHLNIHCRDFIPGQPIAKNIIDAIQRSRKTVLVLTPEFLASTWCRYELRMANMESVTVGRDVTVILLIRHIPKSDIPPEIFYHLHNNTYLEYPDDGQTDIFWTTLAHSISTT